MSLNTTVQYLVILCTEFLKRSFQTILVRSIGYLSLALFTWRFWKFILRPFLHPEYPKEYPYWIPCKNVQQYLIVRKLTVETLVIGQLCKTPANTTY